MIGNLIFATTSNHLILSVSLSLQHWVEMAAQIKRFLTFIFIVIDVICVILLFPSKRLVRNSRVDKSNCQINGNGDNMFTSSGVLMMMTMKAEMMIMMIGIMRVI